MALLQIPVFYSVKTVGGRDIQPLSVDHMCPDVPNTMDLTRLSIIGREHGTTKKTLTLIHQDLVQRKMSFVLILSNVSTAKMTIKQTATHVFIGITLIKFGIVKNNRNSEELEYSSVEILLSLG